MASVCTIVVAGGSGRRFGGAKQFSELAGRSVLEWSIEVAERVSDTVVVVLPTGSNRAAVSTTGTVVTGGASRSESVRAGLRAVPADAEVIVVHDGARPLADERLFRRVLTAVERPTIDGAIPVVSVTDTLRRRDGTPVDRSELVAVQTPQAFRAHALREAHHDAPDATDDAGLVAAAGGTIEVVEGDSSNLKITNPEDLIVAEALLESRTTELQSPTDSTERRSVAAPRVGNGFDIHRFSDDPTRPCIIGGVHIPDARGLEAHSDGDPVAHSIADALLGAVGLGDIGLRFPDTDPAFAGADSLELLRRTVALVAAEGWRPANADCSVIAERPKIGPHRQEMSRRLGDVVGAPVSVKGRRPEGVGSLGRGDAVVVLTSVLVVPA